MQSMFAIPPSISTVIVYTVSPGSFWHFLRVVETMVGFSPYHIANDPYAAVPMETNYDEALARYKKVPYDSDKHH
jgi:hypothetical protein